MSRRTERTGPFLFGLLSVILGLLVLRYLHGPKNLETVLIITTVSGIIMVVTTWWWKISIHAATLAGTLTILTALYGVIILPAFALLGLVSWSRVLLRRHTVAQVIAGSLVSIVLTTVMLLLRGF
jgi:membrane-associated phospholipid phosphatase